MSEQNLTEIVFRSNSTLVERIYNGLRQKLLLNDWKPVPFIIDPTPRALIAQYRTKLNEPYYVGDKIWINIEASNTQCKCADVCHCTLVDRLMVSAQVKPETKESYLEP